MTRVKIEQIECDGPECDKTHSTGSDYAKALNAGNWIRLDGCDGFADADLRPEHTKDFCSYECFLLWFTKEASKLQSAVKKRFEGIPF